MARGRMPDGKSFEQLEKEKKEGAEAKAKAEADKKEPLVLEEDDEFEEFEQEGAAWRPVPARSRGACGRSGHSCGPIAAAC